MSPGFTRTEIFALALSLLFFMLAVIFGILHSENISNALARATGGNHLDGRCVTAECMEAAAWLMGNMDESYDACESFYDRACGNYALQHPYRAQDTETSVLSNMRETNRIRLQEIISSAPVRSQWGHMYEVARMVNNFYQACINQYQRTKSYSDRSNPLLPLLRQRLGTAWWVNDLSNRSASDFDWQAAMRAAALDQNFIFFGLQPLPKANDITKNVLEITNDQSPTFSWQNQFGFDKKKTRNFRSFLLALGSLLARDNGTNTTDPAISRRLEVFADDVINVTARLSRPVMWSQLFGSFNGRYHKVFNYSDFKNQPGNSFVDWDNLISVYTDNKLNMRRETPMVEHFFMRAMSYSYSSAVSTILRNFSRSDPNFRRKMNNYFAFRIAFFWMPDLNYEYNHLFQLYQAMFHSEMAVPDDWELCMNYVDFAMPKTLSALYVAKFYKREEEKTVNEVSQTIRKSLTDEVAALKWMDPATKEAALAKLSKVTFKIGKPAAWINDDAIANEMAALYGSVSISSTDHFGNIKALVDVLRREEVRQLTKGSNPYDHWRAELYEPHIDYYPRWNEILIPAGILQAPLVSPDYPAYMNFGGLGSWIASSLINAIDENGQLYDANYAKTRWWSQPTWDNYNSMKNSVVEFYDTIIPSYIVRDFAPIFRTFTIWTFQKPHVNSTDYAPFAIAETGGLRQAYTAYKRYLAEKRLTEKALPSLAHGNVDQMFFYSYASTHCADYTSHTYAWRTIYGGIMPEFLHVNGGVALMEEFGQAFQCHAGSEMITPEAKQVPFIF